MRLRFPPVVCLTWSEFPAWPHIFFPRSQILLLSGKNILWVSRESVSVASVPLDLVAFASSFFRPCTFFVSPPADIHKTHVRVPVGVSSRCLSARPRKPASGWSTHMCRPDAKIRRVYIPAFLCAALLASWEAQRAEAEMKLFTGSSISGAV